MYLLDTGVASELREAFGANTSRAKIGARVGTRGGSVSASNLFLSVLTVPELDVGCLLLERRDPPQGSTLRSRIDSYALPAFAGRIFRS